MNRTNVAAKELCQELYDLIGWDDTTWTHYWCHNDDTVVNLSDSLKVNGGVGLYGGRYPAYDLGYLLRKLPKDLGWNIDEKLEMFKQFDEMGVEYVIGYHYEDKRVVLDNGTILQTFAAEPEDAACKLAIELFKQGILTRDGEETESVA